MGAIAACWAKISNEIYHILLYFNVLFCIRPGVPRSPDRWGIDGLHSKRNVFLALVNALDLIRNRDRQLRLRDGLCRFSGRTHWGGGFTAKTGTLFYSPENLGSRPHPRLLEGYE